MSTYTTTVSIDGVKKIRGFQALTQNEEVIIEKLVNNINELDGKKAIGFKKTRVEVMDEEFDREAVKTLVEISKEMIESGKENEFVKKVCKTMLEKILRDHVPLDMVDVFVKAYAKRIDTLGSIDAVVGSIESYVRRGHAVPIAQTYRELESELKGA